MVREFLRVPLHQDGVWKGLPIYEDQLHGLPHGTYVSLRVEVHMWNPNGHVCCTHLMRKKVILQAELPQDAHKIALLHVRIDRSQGSLRLVRDDSSHVLALQNVTPTSVFSLKEFCTGIGGLGLGAKYADFHVTSCNEKQAPFAELLRQVSNATVVEGDMSLLDVIAQMHEASPGADSVGVGFNCQSFSSGGDKKGGADERDIHIPTGVFVDSDGRPAAQIEPKQLSHTRQGVVVCDEVEAKPYLAQGPGSLSTEGLLFVLVNPTHACIQQHGEPLRFPAQCKHTGEPILLSAVVLQMGKKPVTRARPTQVPVLEEVAVITVKLMLYRDQVTQPWSQIASAPFKHILSQVPCLSVCRQKQCRCEGWHKEADPMESEPLLDVWNREFLTLHYKRTKAEDADLFSCSARIRADLFAKVSQAAAQQGFFVEPRSPDGRKQHDISPKTSFVIRVNKRYGLKVAREHGEEVHRFFHQDSPFLGDTGLKMFQLGPLPWGTTRATLQKQFGEWQWSAIPLHPIGQSECGRGLMWLVKAKADPACSVVTMNHGDVIIVPRTATSQPTPVIPKVEASQLTKRTLMQPEAEVSFDPWAKAAAQLQSANKPSVDGVSQAQMRQLEDRLTAKIASAKTSEDAEMIPDYEPRFKAMEVQIQQLQAAQQQQMHTTQELKTQVDHQTKMFQQHVDQRMSEQLDKIEIMLNKRNKTHE
eukprot:Skav207561  [mRNA]  locus=scaffold3235:179008:181314:+ [translate_table: standard]